MASPSLSQTAPFFRPPVWGVAVIFTLPLLIFGLLPMLGVHATEEFFTFRRMVLLFALAVGGIAYFWYWRVVAPRPQLIMLFMAVGWTVAEAVNQFLLNEAGINLHLRPLLLLAIACPALWLAWTHHGLLGRAVPWARYYLLFFVWLTGYFLFYNAHAQDPRLAAEESVWSEGSVGILQLTAYFYCLLAMLLSGAVMLKIRNPQGFFDVLNRALFWATSLHAALVLIGFPMGWFSMPLDGFTRATGLFTHPNPYAHHMGLLLVYQLGLFCYYQGPRATRIPSWLLLGSLGLSVAAFLLGLSKTAIGAVGLCGLVLLSINLSIPVVQRRLFLMLAALCVVLPAGLLLFQAATGQSFFALLEARVDQGQSFDWRAEVWQDLLAGIDAGTVWLGHGFTAANAAVFQYTFNDRSNAQPLMMVHNGYLALLYDLGLAGWLMFAAVLSLAWNAWRPVMYRLRTDHQTLGSIILAMALYFLFVCAFDEMTYMFDAPMLFWLLATALWCLMLREGPS